MDIKGEYQIHASRERVWQALNDPEMLKRCIPGCESLEQVGEDEFAARIMAAIGPVRARFNTALSITDSQPPESYRLVGEGKGGAAGFGSGSARVRLEDKDGGTLLSYDAELKVGGKLAQVGSRLVVGATRKMADEFFGAFSTQIDPGAEKIETESAPGAPAVQSRTWLAVAGALLVLLIWWFLLR